jgi:hypothetical protein
MANNDLLVLNELTESGGSLRPSIQVERALAEIKDTFQTSRWQRFLSRKSRHLEARSPVLQRLLLLRQQRDFIAAYFLKA